MVTPRRSMTCRIILENSGVLSSLKLVDFNFDLLPLEKDLLSMEF